MNKAQGEEQGKEQNKVHGKEQSKKHRSREHNPDLYEKNHAKDSIKESIEPEHIKSQTVHTTVQATLQTDGTKASQVLVIGSSHIAKQSVHEISEAVGNFSPDIIAIELDKKRLNAMFGKAEKPGFFSAVRAVGLNGYLFSLLGSYAERKLGEIVGIKPGAEMRHAAKLAKKLSIPLALIDQDIEITLRRFSEEFSLREKLRFVAGFMADIFKGLFLPSSIRPSIRFDLSKVPSEKVIEEIMKEVRKNYPGFYKVLIEERNKVMVNNIISIANSKPGSRILAVIGAGHKADIVKELKKEGKEVPREGMIVFNRA